MSQARVYTVPKSRKEFKCGVDGVVIPKGSRVHHYSVGFRGRQQHRCEAHYPSREDLESSMVGPVYGAIDGARFADCEAIEDFEGVLQEVAEVITEVANEYEASEMYDRNEDLQERAGMLNDAAGELESITFDDEPDESDPITWDRFKDDPNEPMPYEMVKERWLQAQADTAREGLDSLELP